MKATLLLVVALAVFVAGAAVNNYARPAPRALYIEKAPTGLFVHEIKPREVML